MKAWRGWRMFASALTLLAADSGSSSPGPLLGAAWASVQHGRQPLPESKDETLVPVMTLSWKSPIVLALIYLLQLTNPDTLWDGSEKRMNTGSKDHWGSSGKRATMGYHGGEKLVHPWSLRGGCGMKSLCTHKEIATMWPHCRESEVQRTVEIEKGEFIQKNNYQLGKRLFHLLNCKMPW